MTKLSHDRETLNLSFAFIVFAIVSSVVLGFFVCDGFVFAANGEPLERKVEFQESFVTAKVRSVSQTQTDEKLLAKTGIVSRRQIVEVEITEGPLKGTVMPILNEVTDNPAYNIVPRAGQDLILSVGSTAAGGKPEVNISDYRRDGYLILLSLALLALFIVFGGKKGLKSLVGLLLSVLLIAFVLLPLSMNGVNPLLTAGVICLVAASITMVCVAGFSRKAASAIAGTFGGLAVAGIASELVIQSAQLTGLASEEAQILRGSVLTQPPEFYSGLLAAGMLIGALGVIMDVGISIASAVKEVAATDKTLTQANLYKSGMNVGRDIMGTMVSTLVLAYAGGALPLLLLATQMPSTKLLNLDLVATEVTAALTGSLGLVLTIPLTALIASYLFAQENDNARQLAKEVEVGSR